MTRFILTVVLSILLPCGSLSTTAKVGRNRGGAVPAETRAILAFALLADRTTGSIHRVNLIDGNQTDSVVATGLGALRGTTLAGRKLFAFNDDGLLYRLTFDHDWDPLQLTFIGSLAQAGNLAGNAIYVEGKNLYTAGPCGVARFRLSNEKFIPKADSAHPRLEFKGVVATVNVASFATIPEGTLFLLGTSNGALYQVGLTNGKRDWSTLQPYKNVLVDRAAAIAGDPQGNLFAAVSSYRLVTALPVCADPNAVPSRNPGDIPEGVSAIVRIKPGAKDAEIFWYGLPLEFDPPTVGVVGIDAAIGTVAAISKRSPASGSNLILFSTDGQSYTFWTSADEIISVALRPLAKDRIIPQASSSGNAISSIPNLSQQ